jgi:hypothetical protein
MILQRLLRAVVAVVALMVFSVYAHAQLKGINQEGRIDPVPVAIAPFLSNGADDAAATISGVILFRLRTIQNRFQILRLNRLLTLGAVSRFGPLLLVQL